MRGQNPLVNMYMNTKDAVQRSGMWRDAGVLYSRRYKEMISAINVKNYRQLSRRHAASKCLFIGHGSGGRSGGLGAIILKCLCYDGRCGVSVLSYKSCHVYIKRYMLQKNSSVLNPIKKEVEDCGRPTTVLS
jgi:hypothetical protein